MSNLATDITNSPLFGIIITILAFEIGIFINRKTKMLIFNPLLIAIAIIITFLVTLNIDYDSYNKGGEIITLILGPATVAFAIPLYRQLKVLKENLKVIILGIGSGCIASAISIFTLAKIFKFSPDLYYSLIPKSITTTIGMGIVEELGGHPSVVVPVIIITGIVGAIIATTICRICKIKDSVAVGLAMGTAAHAIGTTRAMEIGEIEGAMSSLAIVVAGLMTVIIAPIAAVLIK